jgi:starch synthase
MKVLFVSPEVNPLVRTGGLGDVVGSLPLALDKLGVDVRIVCPFFRSCKDLNAQTLPQKIAVKIGDQLITGSFRQTNLGKSNVLVYLIDIPSLYDREGVYSDSKGDFPDNPQRAFALCQAALQLGGAVKWQPDVIHAHDWMAAPVCAYANADRAKSKGKAKLGTVLTIHNLQHQGVFSYEDFVTSNLPDSNWGMDGFEKNGSLNLLKGGIQHADKITTVSPTYASEIRTIEYGCGLEKSLQYRGADLVGILNGIDYEMWDPQRDDALPKPINPDRPKAGKQACKISLLEELEMSCSQDSPLFGVVARLYDQKGVDLLINLLPRLMDESDASFAILGSGDPSEEQVLRSLSSSFPDRIGSFIGFDDHLARRIFAGSDFFVMPSRFEPCGLAQQYAMRYGSLPIARKTGGLADTIVPFSQGESKSNGFLFSNPTNQDLWSAIQQALKVYANKRKFTQMRKNAISRKCGWDHAAEQYIQTYQWALNLP